MQMNTKFINKIRIIEDYTKSIVINVKHNNDYKPWISTIEQIPTLNSITEIMSKPRKI